MPGVQSYPIVCGMEIMGVSFEVIGNSANLILKTRKNQEITNREYPFPYHCPESIQNWIDIQKCNLKMEELCPTAIQHVAEEQKLHCELVIYGLERIINN